ncbi:LuxR family transcriptional regulator [Chromobacterium piscinae]|uniref:helix-turn-helix transcriptional regulator n=1 Tax=Chromobacterium piscinae TaxID=686831 RepID=UPI001E4F6D0D|nr:LuxR family transcriptional regulator [Chromobacterium piscinae]MCD4504790.1 LuxR family transcriptional regulator [Chromobacterium piscinae]
MTPEVVSMLREVTPLAMAQLVPWQRSLLAMSDQDDLRAFLLGLQYSLPGSPPLLLARMSRDIPSRTPILAIDLGWPGRWLDLYRRRSWHEVDPVILAGAGRPIVWSDELVPQEGDSRRLRDFKSACKRAGMMHGLTYIADRDECRVIISMIGESVEREAYTRQMLSLLLPSLADVAARVLARDARMAKFTDREREVFDLLVWEGLTQKEVAKRLDIGLSTVKLYLKNMRKLHGVKTLSQLAYRVAAVEGS